MCSFFLSHRRTRDRILLIGRSSILAHLVWPDAITHKSSPVLENGRSLSLAVIYVEDNSTFQLNLETFNDRRLLPIIS